MKRSHTFPLAANNENNKKNMKIEKNIAFSQADTMRCCETKTKRLCWVILI